MVSSQTALQIVKSEFSDIILGEETVTLSECLNRTLSRDIISRENLPPFDRSTVDGFAVKASDTFGSSESLPSQLDIVGEILMGEAATVNLDEGQCVKISTGGMLPKGADSVVMVENTDSSFSDFCLVYKSVSPSENVTKKGDDISEGELLFKKGTVLTSREIGVLACMGISSVPVFEKPKVGIISTGDEIVPVESQVSFGKIRDINSHILSALMREKGCESRQYGIVKDNREEIYSALEKAVSENDIVLISGGSSAGTRDMTADIISSLGEVFFHGIALKPGKPTIAGKVNGKAVFGLPGHPTAGYFVTLRFVRPVVDMLLCREDKEKTVESRLVQNISSNHGREEMVCVKITDEGVLPLFGKSGIISLLSRSDGYIIIDRNREGHKQGDSVKVFLFQDGQS